MTTIASSYLLLKHAPFRPSSPCNSFHSLPVISIKFDCVHPSTSVSYRRYRFLPHRTMRLLFLLLLAATSTTSAVARKIPLSDYLSRGDSASQKVDRPCDHNLEAYQKSEVETVPETSNIEWGPPNPPEISAEQILGSKKLGKRRGGGGGKGGGSSSSGGKSGGSSSSGS